MREMWGRKWYQLIKQIGGRISESKRLTADTRKIHDGERALISTAICLETKDGYLEE